MLPSTLRQRDFSLPAFAAFVVLAAASATATATSAAAAYIAKDGHHVAPTRCTASDALDGCHSYVPTSRELTSTNARRNVVPQVRVINLARKGKPSPSAGGGNALAQNALAQKAQKSQQCQSRYRQSQSLSPSQCLVQWSLGQTQQMQRIAWLASPCGPPSWQLWSVQ